MITAACVVTAVETKSGLEQLSPYLRLPLWTAGRGLPSAEDSSAVDGILAGQLSELMTPRSSFVDRATAATLMEPAPNSSLNNGLTAMLSRIREAEREERTSRAGFIGDINEARCRAFSFAWSDRLRNAVAVESSSLADLPLWEELPARLVASTPRELLEMRRAHWQRAEELDEISDKFVFCVPSAGTKMPVLYSSSTTSSSASAERSLLAKASGAFDQYFSPFKKSLSRLTMCFPDKKLVQFDAGKLQTLARLLRDLKQGGHRVLIFTQMSKMLDVLEAFLNLNGHTYLRLDGGTDVDRRQRLMDRFNNDPKVFCFILSTRSGGLGINLTGADTVVFYDSDCKFYVAALYLLFSAHFDLIGNPAMDAQAQDRAHRLVRNVCLFFNSEVPLTTRPNLLRIGQTREVHIYRLVTEHSIEENILTKAKQKRNLDFLVMDEGKFHATDASRQKDAMSDRADEDQEEGFTKSKLQHMLGVSSLADDDGVSVENDVDLNKEQLESAMNELEDADDVRAMQSAKQEAEEDLKEFDDARQGQDGEANDGGKSKKNVGTAKAKTVKKKKRPSNAGSDDSGSRTTKDDDTDEEQDMEKEFATWQKKAGMDSSTIQASLNPLERYGLHVKEYIDPFFSKYYW